MYHNNSWIGYFSDKRAPMLLLGHVFLIWIIRYPPDAVHAASLCFKFLHKKCRVISGGHPQLQLSALGHVELRQSAQPVHRRDGRSGDWGHLHPHTAQDDQTRPRAAQHRHRCQYSCYDVFINTPTLVIFAGLCLATLPSTPKGQVPGLINTYTEQNFIFFCLWEPWWSIG